MGFSSNEGVKVGYPPKRDVILPLLALTVWKWLQIGTDLLHIITSTGDVLFRFVNIDDLERPWTPKRRVLVNFFRNFRLWCTFHKWIAPTWLKVDLNNLQTATLTAKAVARLMSFAHITCSQLVHYVIIYNKNCTRFYFEKLNVGVADAIFITRLTLVS